MKIQLSALLVLTGMSFMLSGQVRYTGEMYRDYYQWFHQYSQTADFYLDGTELISFVDDASVHSQPSAHSSQLATLQLGQGVTNIAVPVAKTVFSSQNGYREQWFQVAVCQPDGNLQKGYIWGGYLAKSWRFFDVDADGQQELIALGLSQDVRQQPQSIQAELKIIKASKEIAKLVLESFCLFEDCGSSSLLRIFDFRQSSGKTVFEASTFTTGCLTGIDKALIAWDGKQFQLVYQAEYTTGHIYASHPLYLRHAAQTQICYYDKENAQYDPIWSCQTVQTASVAVP